MTVEPLVPDAPPAVPARAPLDADAFMRALDDAGSVLSRAAESENRFAAGSGSLGDAIYDRARADVVMSVATAAAQRTAQAITTLFNLQL